MAEFNVLTDGKTRIGPYSFRDRKKPALCVAKGNEVVCYGYFHSEEAARLFMVELAVLIGAKEATEVNDG